jgi:prepilin-type processing-associated H-X9-DG protein
VRFVWWMDMIFPYVRAGTVYACPSNPGETDMERMTNEPPERDGCLGGRRGLFIGNYRYLGYSVNRSLTRPISIAELPRPTDTCVFFDSFPQCSTNPPPPTFSRSWISSPGRKPRHHEGLNVVYADGHVRYQKARWSPAQDTWVVTGGPYDDRPALFGIVVDDGTLWVP